MALFLWRMLQFSRLAVAQQQCCGTPPPPTPTPRLDGVSVSSLTYCLECFPAVKFQIGLEAKLLNFLQTICEMSKQ